MTNELTLETSEQITPFDLFLAAAFIGLSSTDERAPDVRHVLAKAKQLQGYADEVKGNPKHPLPDGWTVGNKSHDGVYDLFRKDYPRVVEISEYSTNESSKILYALLKDMGQLDEE